MAENLDTQSVSNSPISAAAPVITDSNQATKANLETTVGSTMQQTLFWDYDKNTPPTNLKPTLSKDYPNLISGPGPKSNTPVKTKSPDQVAMDVWNKVVQNNPGIDRSNITNPGEKVSRYDENAHNAVGYIRGADNESLHAARLGGFDYAMVGVRNGLLKGATVALGSIGMLGALPGAALNGDLSQAADNWLTKWSDKVYDNKINQIYHPEGYQDKSAISKLGTATWWADQGADMAGFVAGNLLPASIVSKIGLIGRASKLLGNALYAEKAAALGASAVGTELGTVAKIGNTLANNTRWLNSMTTLETAATSAFTESGYEGMDTKRRIYQDLMAKGYSPDQAMQIATKNANTVIGLNMAVLLPSSLWEVNALLKGGANLSAAARYIRNGVNGAELSAPSIGKYIGKVALGAGEGALVEGVWEENVQNSIQLYADKLSKNQVNPGVAGMFKSLLSDSIDNFSTPEGQENILGGVVMGVLMGGYSGGKEVRNNYKEAQKILPKYNSSYTSYEQVSKDLVTLSNYLKDKSNYIQEVNGAPKLDDQGNVVINKGKLISDIKSLGLTVDLSNTMAKAAEEGNTNLLAVAKNQLIGEFTYNHSSNGMSDRMFNKLSTWQQMSPDEQASLGIVTEEKDADGNIIPFATQINEIKAKAKEYDKLWNHIDAHFPDVLAKDRDGNEYGYDTKGIFQESVLNKSLLDRLDSINNEILDAQSQMEAIFDQNVRHNSHYLKTKLTGQRELSLNPFSNKLDSTEKVSAYLEVNPESALSKQYAESWDQYENYRQALDSSNKRYVKLTSKDAVIQKLSKTISSKEKAEDKIKEKETLAQQEEAKKQAEKESQLNDEALATGTVVENKGTSQSDEDIMANAQAANVISSEDQTDEELAAMISDDDIANATDANIPTGTNPVIVRPSDSLGATTLEKAQKAAAYLINKAGDASGNLGLENKTAEEIIEMYDNLAAKKDNDNVWFGGKPYKLGSKIYDTRTGRVWKVKGVDLNGAMTIYDSLDPQKTTVINSQEEMDNYDNVEQESAAEQAKKQEKKKPSTQAVPIEPDTVPNKLASNAFRIPNGNTFIEIFQNTFTMSKEAINELVTRVGADELLANTTIIFEREKDAKKLEKIRANDAFRPMDSSRNTVANDQLWVKTATPFRFKILYKGELIGFGTNPNKYIFKDKYGKIISPNNFTQEQFEAVYDTNQKNPVTLEQFKKNYTDSVKLYTELYNRIGNTDSITLNPYDVSQLLGIKINAGEYDYSVDKQYKLSELNYNTIAGEVYAIDMQNSNSNGGRSIVTAISDPTKLTAIEDLIQEQLQGPLTPEILKNYGRYVAAIQLPNGAIKFVELSSSVLTDEEKNKILVTLQERQVESFTNIKQTSTINTISPAEIKKLEDERDSKIENLKNNSNFEYKPSNITGSFYAENNGVLSEVSPNSVKGESIFGLEKISDTEYRVGSFVQNGNQLIQGANVFLKPLFNEENLPTSREKVYIKEPAIIKREGNIFTIVKKGSIYYDVAPTGKFLNNDIKNINREFDEQVKNLKNTPIKNTGTIKREALDNNFNDPFNDKLNQDIFIAVKDIKGLNVRLEMSPTGILRVDFTDYSDPSASKYATIYINKELSTYKNFDEVIKDINDGIKTHNDKLKAKPNDSVLTIPTKIEKTSFKKGIPKNLTTDQYMDLQTSVNPGIVKNASLEIEVKDFTPSPKTSTSVEVSAQETIDSTPSVQDTATVVDESTQQLIDIQMARIVDKLTGKEQITPQIREFITTKLRLDPSNSLETMKDFNKKYLDTYDNKTEATKAPVEVADNKKASILNQLDAINKAIQNVKDAATHGTLLDENGNPFLDKKTTNIYAKGLLNDLKKKQTELQNQLPKDNTAALKVIATNTPINNQVSLNEFKSWLKQNLPSYIDVVDIDTLMNNISVNGLSLGIFQTNLETINGKQQITGGSIGTREENAFKYHESFHAIFRLLLPESRIKTLLSQAEREFKSNILKSKKQTLAQAITEFKQSSSLYTNLTDQQAEERLYEEYMADKFDQWKTNKSVETSSAIKTFFKQIADWFRAFTTRLGLAKQDMMGLFEDVNRGRYKNVSIQANRFTNTDQILQDGMIDDHNRPIDNLFPTQAALKLIKIGQEQTTDEFGNVVVSPKYLTQAESTQIVGSVTAVFLNRVNSWTGSLDGLVDKILEDYGKLYDSNNDVYTERDDYMDIVDKLDSLHTAYTNEESKASLKDAINYSLEQLGYKQSEEEQRLEDDNDELGDRQVGNYTIETSAIGGFGSLSKDLRRYIASTTYQVTDSEGNPLGDDFGNKMLTENEPLVEAVNSNIVYGGILKALANINDQTVFVNRLVQYSEGDTQSAKFIQRFMNDTGLVVADDGTFTITKNPTLFQMVVKGFNQYKVDYLFTKKDANNKVSDTFLSNQKDVAQTQFAQWYNSFTDLYQSRLDNITDTKEKEAFIKSRLRVFTELGSFLGLSKSMSMPDLDKHSKILHTTLKASVGIDLSPNYLKYSIISGMKADIRTAKQVKYFNAFSGVTPLSIEDVNQINKNLQDQNNPFVKEQVITMTMDENGQDVEATIEKDKANIGRLKKIAENNAIFDETVIPSSFVNAENKTIYGHQLPTFHLIATTDLTSRDYRKQLKKDPYLKNNYLLNSALFEKVADTLRVARIDGLRQVTLSQDGTGNYFENATLDVNKRDGITYGKYSDREFLLNLFDLYLYQNEHNYQNEKNETVRFNTAAHLIRVLEASSTGDTVSLPIQRLFQDGNITESAKDALVNEVINEYRRIQEVKGEIKDIESGAKTTGIIQDYHNGKLRGLRFFKTSNMLGNLRSELENKAHAEKNIKLTEEEIKAIRDQVTEYFRDQVNTLMTTMVSQNILQGNSTNGFTNVLLPTEIERGNYDNNGKSDASLNDKMFLTTDLKNNIGQIYMNDFMNTLAYNQLILGDAAKGLKDSVDEVKRAKGANGAGPSIEARITAPELGINHSFTTSHIGVITEPKGTVQLGSEGRESSVDRADAQMWLTPKGLRYTLFGLGKLNARNAAFLDKIEKGEDILKDDVFGDNGSLEYNGQTNSIKLVYYDGHKYVKTSGAMLQRQALSYKDEQGQWRAIPGREELHNMLDKMETFESANNTVSFIVPKSASKAISEDVMKTDMSDFTDDKMKPLQNKFWRLQLENPSNKVLINDPTQAKQLIDMEQDDSTQVLFRGTETTVGDLRQMYQNDSEQRVKNNYFKARNSIFNIDEAFSELQQSIDQNKVTPKLAEFQARALEALQASGADSQLMGFFEVDENGNPKYNLNMSMTLDKYTQLFLAYFSKGVTNEKVPGHAIALMSDYGMQMMRQVTAVDENGRPTQWRTIRADEFKKNPKKYFFKDLNTDKFQVGDYYTSDLQHNVPEYNSEGKIVGYYSEFMLPAHFAEMMDIKPGDPIPDSVAKAFGVRIPSQDKHSFISLKMVEFLPANMGSTGIFAKELVSLSGADFDIDKLYMSIASWYKNQTGDLVRYGDTATTDQEKFDEFLHYELNNNKDLKKKVKKKVKANKDYNSLSKLKINNQSVWSDQIMDGIDEEFESGIVSWDEINNLKPDEINSFIKNKLGELKKVAINEALTELGLPNNLNDFIEQSKKGELNNGVLNNRILDAKIQFLTNDHIRPDIASEAAGVDLLAKMVNDPDLKAAVIQELNLDTDSMLGKTSAFKNNKEGANNIGPAVNAMLVYSLLNKYGIGMRRKFNKETLEDDIFKLTIDGKIFDSYENTIATDGNRIMNNISTVVSAMTDNAKERLAAKFNMSMSAIGTLCNMLAQGVPMKTTVSMLLQPSIKQYFDATKRFSYNFSDRSDKMLNGEKVQKAEIGKFLLDSIKATIPEGEFDANYAIRTEELLAHTRGEANNPMLQWKVLNDYMQMETQSRFYSSISQIIKLAKGLGTSFDYGDDIRENMDKLGLNMNDKDFSDSKIPFDVRQILTGKDSSLPYHNITSNYIKIFNQINELSKSLFIEKTNTFGRIKDIVFSNMDFSKDEFNIPEEAEKMKKNLISYLTFKSYIKLMNDEGKSSRVAGLSNRLIYDNIEGGANVRNIVDVLRMAREAAPDNYLVKKFLMTVPTTIKQKGSIVKNPNNKDGINKVESNTWAKISNTRAEMLQDSFKELYNNPETKQYAITLFNYLIVKDGLQFKSGSFMKLVPNFMFYDVLRGTTRANEVMKLDTKSLSQSELDQKYRDTFGNTQSEIFNDFIDVYLSNINNSFHIPQITGVVKNNVEKKGIKYSSDLKNELLINIFADVRESQINSRIEDGKLIVESNAGTPLTDSEKSNLSQNLTDIKDSGFRIENYEDNGKKRVEVNFPYIITVPTGKNQKTYYKLTSVGNIGVKQDAKASDFIKLGNTISTGTRATYTQIQLKGSRAQTSIGQMFGNLPDTNSISTAKTQTSLPGNNSQIVDASTDADILGNMSMEEFEQFAAQLGGDDFESFELKVKQGQNDVGFADKIANADNPNLNTDPDYINPFNSAVNDDIDSDMLDDFFGDDDQIQEGMKKNNSQEGNC